MSKLHSISAKDVIPEEIAQVRLFLTEMPLFSPLRLFIKDMLNALEEGQNLTLIFDEPEK